MENDDGKPRNKKEIFQKRKSLRGKVDTGTSRYPISTFHPDILKENIPIFSTIVTSKMKYSLYKILEFSFTYRVMKPIFIGKIDISNVQPNPENRAINRKRQSLLEGSMMDAVLDEENPIILKTKVSTIATSTGY
jgi:hypothetical protein